MPRRPNPKAHRPKGKAQNHPYWAQAKKDPAEGQACKAEVFSQGPKAQKTGPKLGEGRKTKTGKEDQKPPERKSSRPHRSEKENKNETATTKAEMFKDCGHLHL